MNEEKVIQNIEEWVKAELLNEKSGHDWYHIKRVTDIAKEILKYEKANTFIVTAAALLHDIADDKVTANVDAALERIRELLESNEVAADTIDTIFDIITTMSFKGGTGKKLSYVEAQIVQDADRLDALGAIGIARTFQYGGSKGQAMYDPEIPVRDKMSFEEYRNGESTSINHFYEKLLLLKDKMNTPTAVKMAEERELFMKHFLDTFFKEWNGEL
ncbi:MAG: HD domain-containing protein [Jeotgalicoccus sp.]